MNLPEPESSRRLDYMKSYFKNRRKWFNDYKATLSCSRCGFSHPAAMQFHHVRGTKKMAVSHMVLKKADLADVLAEIAKCDVLCANCHFILHYEEGRKGGRPRGLKPKAKVKGVTYHVI